jgi:hypothetical protein
VLERRGRILLILLPGCMGGGSISVVSPATGSHQSGDDFMRVLLSMAGDVALSGSCDVALEQLARGPP